MSQPPDQYSRTFDFTDFSAMQPSAQQPGQKIDQELNNAQASINQTIDRLNEIQRDDGKVRASALDTTEFTGIVNAATATATNAAASATASASTATTKASEATASATTASNAATSATGSAGVATAQAGLATTAATTATTKATEASNSAASALASQTSATASAATATTKAAEASGSAATATTQASNAAISANTATAQGNLATAAAVAAGNSASAASTSAISASNSASAAAASAASIMALDPVEEAPINGTQYARKDGGWAAAIIGDKYYSLSTTSLSVSNGTKTLTIATGLSYTTQQSVIVAYDATHHMHGTVTSYNSSTGVIVVDVSQHTGSGTYSLWTVNVGGISSTAEWGLITGTLSAQTDLNSALALKSNLASPAFSGVPTAPTPATSDNSTTLSTTAFVKAQGYLISAPVTSVAGRTGAITLSNSDISGLGTMATANAADYAALAGATFAGKINTLASTATTAGFNIPQGVAPSTPVNGDIWTTTSGLNVRTNGVTNLMPGLGSNNIFSNANSTFGSATATGTIGLASGATISGATKTVNIGTGGVAGSTTTITIGSTTGTSTTALNGTVTATTQTAGDNSTKVATTAFVLANAGSPAYATNEQTLTGTSTTTAINPLTALLSFVNPASFAIAPSGMTAAQTAGSTTATGFSGTVSSGTTTAGYALRYINLQSRGNNTGGGINWTRPQGIAVRMVSYFQFQTQTVFRLNLGGSAADLATPTTRSIGVSYGASSANVLSALILEVHDGTTFTPVTTSFTPTFAQTFDVAVYSDGAGNVSCFVNGSLVGSTSLGPKTASASGQNTLQVGYLNTSAPTTYSNGIFSHLKYFVN